ncbi:MAG TPA: amidase [Steroidobacteraceae bacterium]|nr:amidase [Steroidobacteraceae bacterium]
MNDEPSGNQSAGVPITRRHFGQAVGLLTVAATIPTVLNAATEEICRLSAVELTAMMQRRAISAREVMAAYLARIERVNPKVNAIVTLAAERAMADAAKADELAAKGGTLGALHGLPIAHKDLVDTAGIRTTMGSRFYRDNVPMRDSPFVARSTAAGAITCGKTNTPEFGAGSQTFNAVFGATLNPYEVTKTCGGSSGGAAVALACDMVPIAGGSDTGGSLRNPAAFCNIVGFRPSPGRVVSGSPGSWSPLTVWGPMARSAADVALFLSVLAGKDLNSALSIREDGAQFRVPLERDFKGARVAWWRGLGGIPFEPEIRRVIDANRRIFENLGCIVEEAEPDFSGVEQAFPLLRYAENHPRYSALVRQRPEWVKDTIKFEVEQAERISAADVGRALARHAQMHEQSRQFFERFDYFILPVTQVAPFDVSIPYLKEVAGTAMATYIDWMRSCWYISFMSNPCISVPGGFTASGLPVGIQIVGRHNSDLSVLQMAYAFEQSTRFKERRAALIDT